LIEEKAQAVQREHDGQQRAPTLSVAKPTEALARFASQVDIDRLQPLELAAAKRHLLDALGACIAGGDEPLLRRSADLLGQIAGSGEIPVPGTSLRTNLLSAAYLTSVACHAIELDDGNREGSIHPGTVVVPALLSSGYAFNANGHDLLGGLIAGFEVAVGLAEVLHPHAARRGFQTTGVAGVIGAAAGVARLLSLDPLTTEKAMGIAASASAGIFAYLTGGGNIKKLHPAHAAREGIFAALLARDQVVDGPLGVAESKCGVFDAFAGLAPWNASVKDHRSGALAITRSYIKPYPCCRHIHPAIDGLLELKTTHDIDPDRVTRIDVGTYDAAMPHASLGWDSFTVSQLSFPYVMGVALRTGHVNLQSFSESARTDELILRDTQKVHVTPDAECCASYPKQGPARVTVTMNDGTVFTAYVAQPLGAPEKPITDDALFEKFRMASERQLNRQQADSVIARVWNLDSQSSVRSLVDALCV
jgi:2-methylcitrate dehydratase PrpD